jgi:hypothetical protein
VPLREPLGVVQPQAGCREASLETPHVMKVDALLATDSAYDV